MTTERNDDEQNEDLAADLRDHGHTWAEIAAAVNLTPSLRRATGRQQG